MMTQRTLRLLTTYATAERSIQPGGIGTFDEPEASDLIAGGYAIDETKPANDTVRESISDVVHSPLNPGDDLDDQSGTTASVEQPESNDSGSKADIETASVEQPETTGRRGGKHR